MKMNDKRKIVIEIRSTLRGWSGVVFLGSCKSRRAWINNSDCKSLPFLKSLDQFLFFK